MGRTAKKRTWRHIDCDDEADQIALRSLPSSSLFSVDNEGRPAKKAKAAVVASAKRTSAKDGNRPTGTGHPSASLTESLPTPAKTYDLWMDSPAPVQDPWLSTAPSNGCRKARHRLPPEAIRVGRASASIQCAEPGQSYNPSPADHAEAVRRAQEAYLEETRDDRRFAAAIQSARQTPTVDECSGTDDDDNEAGTDSIIVGGTAPGRMTRAQRNKRARHLDALRQARRRTAERRLLHQIACLPSKASSVLISKASASKKEGTRTAGSVRRQVRLGPLKQTCSEFPSVLLADDLTGNLRSTVVPSVCNALTQSYVAMQARGYIETRRLAPRPVRRVRLCSRYRHEMDD
ncbi:unnamed protein product (mitochondrion) [Plasmodiophora brassicae]|uniref:Ribosome biogenesis protein NOP53 n=1 Tax=Plasmodiophora brassicae TaxID=37360 RepID=A0A0G4IUB6_PLABS|nr:hypothetical protein PBRA_006941 [Plasmodiophora brassicae]SPR00554.1 unnamed protein product [Plasmodiophora brassicae]